MEDKKFHSAIVETQKKGHKRTNTGGSINLEDKKIFHGDNYINTEPLPNNQLFMLLNHSGVKNKSIINKKEEIKEDAVISCLTNSLKIFDKIQKDFEMSAKNNILNIEENRNLSNGENTNRTHRSKFRDSNNTLKDVNSGTNPSSLTNSPVKGQSNKELIKLGLQVNKIRDLNYYQVVNVSEIEKRTIARQIEDNSESRMKNYSDLFGIINITLEDIKESIKVLNNSNNASYFTQSADSKNDQGK